MAWMFYELGCRLEYVRGICLGDFLLFMCGVFVFFG